MSTKFSILSIRARFMAFVGTTLLVMSILIGASTLVFVYTTERDSWRARQSEAAKNAADEVADYLLNNEALLRWVDEYGFDEIQNKPELLRDILLDYPDFLEIIFVNKNGKPIYSVARNQPILSNQFTILQSEWFQTANSGGTLYTAIQTSPQNESYTIFAMPSWHGGVLAAQIQMDALWETVAQIRFGETGRIYIVSQTGQVIAHPDKQVVLSNKNIGNTELFKKIMSNPTHQWTGDSVNFSGVKVVITSMPIGSTDWVVITELPRREAYAATNLSAILIPSGILLLATIATFAFREALQHLFLVPLALLRTGIKQVREGNLSHRIAIPRMDEFGEVMAGFNTMSADLAEQHHNLRTYTSDLENRVRERTHDLTLLNESLMKEVSERQAAEKIALSSLSEKEVLLKEIHHRVKNNLQIISSLLNLQASRVKDTGALRTLQDSQARVRSMALIHEKLYNSRNLASIDFGEYVRSLTAELFRSYKHAIGNIQLKINADQIFLDIDRAIPCGLILNELVTNALKYAFPGGRNGTIWVEMHQDAARTITLRVADNGVGLPADLNLLNTKSLGWQLINNLVAQLDGKVSMDNSTGTDFRITFES